NTHVRRDCIGGLRVGPPLSRAAARSRPMGARYADPCRRDFLHALGVAVAGFGPAALAREQPRTAPAPRPRPASKQLAVVTTAYYYLSHAYHLCGRFLHGYLHAGRLHYPDFRIAGMHAEQQKEGDLSRELAQRHGFTLYPDVAGALTLGGGRLAVDGV